MSGPDFHAVDGPAPTTQSWRSGQAPDPHWSAPVRRDPVVRSPDPVIRPRRSRVLMLGVPVLALALVIGLLAALGGFDRRTDRVIPVAAGATVTTGPLAYVFTKTTAQKKESLGKQITEVIVYGTAQTTGTEGMEPQPRQFAGRDLVDRLVQDPEITKIGTAENYANGRTLTPGLPPVEFRLEFEFPAGWQPSSTFRVGIADLTYVALYLGSDDPHWENDSSRTYRVDTPMRVLPAQQ